jgi:CheY-like chemotaxis protein
MGQGKHILVVDENEAVCEVIVNILKEHHYRVRAVSDQVA